MKTGIYLYKILMYVGYPLNLQARDWHLSYHNLYCIIIFSVQ